MNAEEPSQSTSLECEPDHTAVWDLISQVRPVQVNPEFVKATVAHARELPQDSDEVIVSFPKPQQQGMAAISALAAAVILGLFLCLSIFTNSSTHENLAFASSDEAPLLMDNGEELEEFEKLAQIEHLVSVDDPESFGDEDIIALLSITL